jgi:hypothetical protein
MSTLPSSRFGNCVFLATPESNLQVGEILKMTFCSSHFETRAVEWMHQLGNLPFVVDLLEEPPLNIITERYFD